MPELDEGFAKYFFWRLVIPRTIWRMFLGSVFVTLSIDIVDNASKIFVLTLGLGVILGSIYGCYRAINVLFADSEQVK